MTRQSKKRWLLPSPRRIWRFLRNDKVPAWRKGIAYAALAYVIFPFDAIPDLAPLAGWLDDMGIASLALVFLSWALGDEAIHTPQLPPEKDREARERQPRTSTRDDE